MWTCYDPVIDMAYILLAEAHAGEGAIKLVDVTPAQTHPLGPPIQAALEPLTLEFDGAGPHQAADLPSGRKCPLMRPSIGARSALVRPAALGLALALAGCGTVHLANYEPRQLERYASFRADGGVAVAADAVTDRGELKRYFGEDLMSLETLPVMVMIENRNATTSFVIVVDRITLRSEDVPQAREDPAGPHSSQAVATTGGALAAAGVLAPPLAVVAAPLVLGIGSGMVLRSNTIRHNLLDKQLRSDTLSPGQFTRGFLYFRLPKVDATSARLSLHVEAMESGSGRTVNLDLPISPEASPR